MRHLKAQSDAFKPLQTVFYHFQPTAQPTRSTTKALVGHSSTLPFNEAPGTAPLGRFSAKTRRRHRSRIDYESARRLLFTLPFNEAPGTAPPAAPLFLVASYSMWRALYDA